MMTNIVTDQKMQEAHEFLAKKELLDLKERLKKEGTYSEPGDHVKQTEEDIGGTPL
jgi:hypothetical protein